jgi:soluble lytic murein transglycosylase-like protein
MRPQHFLLLGFFLASSVPAGAELAILSTGDFIKVKAFEVQGERMRLELARGGVLTLPLDIIERVVDDEIPLEPEPVPEPPAEATFHFAFHPEAAVPATPFGDLIFQTAQRFDLNPTLVAAVIRAESAFDPRAVSIKGARGLMQLMPATAQRFGVQHDELFDPARNLEAGMRYLEWLLRRFDGDLPRALAAYNAGEGAVDRYDGVPPYRETRRYLKRIYTHLGLPADQLPADV